MQHIPKMTDLAYSDDEKTEMAKKNGPSSEDGVAPVYRGPDYPYGTTMCMTERELELGGLDSEDIGIGDMVHMHILARVTSVGVDKYSDNPDKGKPPRRVELQITHLSAEDEDGENEESDTGEKKRHILDKLYGG